MAGLDSNTKLLIHCNGVDESTTFTDESSTGHTVTANGSAVVDTAEKKFGTGSCLMASFGDYLSVADHADWDFSNNDWTIDCWVYLNSASPSTTICSRVTSGSSYFYISWEGGNLRVRDFGGSIDFSRTITETTGSWFHLAIVRSGTNMYIFKDGVQQGATASVSTTAFIDRAVPLEFGRMSQNGGYYIDGWIDEIRVSDTARWTTTFTPPTEEYSDSGSITVTPDVLTITSSIPSESVKIDTIVTPNVLSINASVLEGAYGQVVTVTPSVLTITSSVQSPTEQIDATVTPDILTITSSTGTPIFPVHGSLIGKIIHTNPLLAVTDTSPAKIIKIDISDPENLSYTDATISSIDYAKDVSVDSSGTYVYVAGSSGKVVKILISDLADQTLIDLSDTDNVLTIETNENYGITYAGTDSTTGELYTIDERDTFEIDSEFTCLSHLNFKLKTYFSIVDAFKMDSDFTCLSYTYFKMNSDFKCLTKEITPITSVDDIVPIDLSDYIVKINGVQLENTDVDLDSISITHSIDSESMASFKLTRKHDNLNTTLEGVSSIITNQNTVEIICDGVTIFPLYGEGTGKISELDCVYENEQEYINVHALVAEPTNKVNTVTMSLPGASSRLNLYDVLLNNPRIYNPYVDPTNEDSPKKYKGIKADLGKIIKQHNQWFSVFDSFGEDADEIQEGTWEPDPGWTYYWSPTVDKIQNPEPLNIEETTLEEDEIAKVEAEQRALPINKRTPSLVLGLKLQQISDNIAKGLESVSDNISKNLRELAPLTGIRFNYIGTSLAPVSDDLWNLTMAGHWKQAKIEDSESGNFSSYGGSWVSPGSIDINRERLRIKSTDTTPGYVLIQYTSYYEIGEAPFKEISVKNGIKYTKPYLQDKENGLYKIKDASYDYRKYVAKVCQLEYEKLKNINGDILPETSCTLSMTIDAFLYYHLHSLTRINLDNTTASNIYKNANGFPVSIKSITITSNDRKVSIEADNTMSNSELEIINGEYPDPDDEEYNEPEFISLIAKKSDMRKRLEIERALVERDQLLESEAEEE